MEQQIAKKTTEEFLAPVNIIENENGAVFTLNLPGVSENDIDITVDGEYLTIEGKASAQYPENFKPLYQEFSFGNLKRKFKIPKPVDSEKARAEVKNGQLVLTIPYSEAGIKKISVNHN
ncbi:MAG: Hsp20/alpha crystallin family protein [Spirochaetia bacterium]|nr:Hsp20/alpha crystallin family protein [Spirochaetia bacterium]